MDTDCNDEIIVGTNEEFIIGFSLLKNKDGSITFEHSFSNHAHIGRVKQVAVCKNFLVTGSTDEFIKIFNLRNRKEIGNILSQEGTINCLQFHESGFLFSGSEDGTIGIFKIREWRLLKELKGHVGAITGLAVHPSGKLALSVAKDKRVITWDLMKGKKVHTAGLKKAGEYIMWSPDGSHYLIASENILNIYSIAHGNIVQTIDFKDNIYCFRYLTDKLLVIGGERKSLILFDLESKTEIVEWEAHENRTKSIAIVDSTELSRHISTASSDGFIKIWKINLSNVKCAPKLLGEVNTKSRIICMAFKPKENTSMTLNNSNLAVIESKLKRKRETSEEQVHTKSSKKKKQNKNKKENKVEIKEKKEIKSKVVVEYTSEDENTFNFKKSEIGKSDKIVVNKNNNKGLVKGNKNNSKTTPVKKGKKKVHFKNKMKKIVT